MHRRTWRSKTSMRRRALPSFSSTGTAVPVHRHGAGPRQGGGPRCRHAGWASTSSRGRRGGGAVYRDEGCLCWSFVNTCGTRRSIVEWVISALASLGVVVAHNGRNDLLWERRKVAGTAWSSDEGRTVFHGTLLFSTDIGKMIACLRRRGVDTRLRSWHPHHPVWRT